MIGDVIDTFKNTTTVSSCYVILLPNVSKFEKDKKNWTG